MSEIQSLILIAWSCALSDVCILEMNLKFLYVHSRKFVGKNKNMFFFPVNAKNLFFISVSKRVRKTFLCLFDFIVCAPSEARQTKKSDY